MNCVTPLEPDYFFCPEQRLRTASDYDAVFKQPKRSRDRNFLVLACLNQLSHPRLGLIVSKKRLRRAVSRNRIKRIVRNDFRLHQHQLPAIDIVVLAYQLVETESNEVLTAALAKHWRRLDKIFATV